MSRTILGITTVRVSSPFGTAGQTQGWAASFDGDVKVYDSVAGHFTSAHSLTAAQIRSVKSRLAA